MEEAQAFTLAEIEFDKKQSGLAAL